MDLDPTPPAARPWAKRLADGMNLLRQMEDDGKQNTPRYQYLYRMWDALLVIYKGICDREDGDPSDVPPNLDALITQYERKV